MMTVEQFLESLGGPTKVSQKLGVPFTTVWSWRERNSIPQWRMAKVAELAHSEGKPVPAQIGKAA